jgi:hypothetical protein
MDVPEVCMKKLICPGTLSKKVVGADETVKVTGIVIEIFPAWEVTTIWPV